MNAEIVHSSKLERAFVSNAEAPNPVTNMIYSATRFPVRSKSNLI